MVFVDNKFNGIIEIWDFTGGCQEPRKSSLETWPNIAIPDFIHLVSFAFQHTAGTFGLILKWGRSKVNLMDVRKDLTLRDIGVDFSSGIPYTLLITEWASSPSDNDELIDLDAKDKRQLTEVGVDMSSPSKVMPLGNEKSKSPTDEKENATETTTDELDAMGMKFPVGGTPACGKNDDLRKVPLLFNEDLCRSRNSDRRTALRNEDSTRFEHRLRELLSKPRSEDGETISRTETGYVGLVNQAMTCYLNSLIQALYMTPEFRNALYNWEYVDGSEKDEAKSIPYQLQKLFLNLQTSSKNAIETTSLTKSFGWDSTEAWQQHDIQELCRVMFDALEQKFKNTEQADLIDRLYQGKMIDYVKCLECGKEKSREDTFLDIPLPVRPFGSNVAYNSVEEALGAFVQPETLDGTNQYHCETCNKKCDAHKGLKFTKFPYFLTLHLKRFDFDFNTFHRIKLNDEVTFPAVLNLNSFISSTSDGGLGSTEENSSVPVKTEQDVTKIENDVTKIENDVTKIENDVTKTVNDITKAEKERKIENDVKETEEEPAKNPYFFPANSPEDRPVCKSGITDNENSTVNNHEENGEVDDKEGETIEKSNGPSTSSSKIHNHENEKKGDSAGPPGPFIYELFSIMIHSGSASGGHYYAYIKDFRTGEWLCFNDQNVLTITYEDIQKTYGGGSTRAYYSGVYSSSSNAYMLMYRQIDPARNALPMQVADFPKHLQELLLKMTINEENERKNRGINMELHKLTVYCQHPLTKATMTREMFCLLHSTLTEFTDLAYKMLRIDKFVDRDQVRLVSCRKHVDVTDEEREHLPLHSILGDETELFMEIRNKNETFKNYSSRGFTSTIYVIDAAKKEVTKGPINFTTHTAQTIQECKEELAPLLGMEPKDINFILQFGKKTTRLVTSSNGSTLEDENFRSACRVFVPTSSGSDANKTLDNIYEIMYFFSGLMGLFIHLPDLSEGQLRALGIPTLEETKKGDANPQANATPKVPPETSKDPEKTENNVTTTKSNENEDLSTILNKTTSEPAIQTESEDWQTQEQSNSEDSSLSYSDRTLVGEGDASEDDDYLLANVDHEFSHQPSQENGRIKDSSEYFCHISRDDQQPDKLLKVLVDKRMQFGSLKKMLESHIGVPTEHLKVFCQSEGGLHWTQMSAEMRKLGSDTELWIRLRRALRSDEFKVSLYLLSLDSELPYDLLDECIISKEATVGETKKDILTKMNKNMNENIPLDRCRLRQKNHKTAGPALLDHQKFKDLQFGWHPEIIVQKLSAKETITDETQVLLFVIRMPISGAGLNPIQEIVVAGNSLSEVREKIAEISEIPEEHLEIAKGQISLTDLTMLSVPSNLDWNRELLASDNSPIVSLVDGTIVYYRDSRDQPFESSVSEENEMYARRTARMQSVSGSSIARRSRRRERALKIHVDDM